MKPAPIILFVIFLTSTIKTVSAQGPQLANVVKPSPNVQAMQKYGDIPISAYTGIPSISIPIYTVKFRDITLPVSLSYHASGIKVSEEASQVGLGWVLNAAGTVSRNIVGKDDFLYNYFNTAVPDFSDGNYPFKTVDSKTDNVIGTGCRFSYISSTGNQTLNTIDLLNQFTGSPVEDFQPDQYYFNFPGQSGKFVLRRDKTAILQTQRKMKINFDGSLFSIVDIDGTRYDFALTETYNDGSQNHTSAWYLTKITSASGNIVTFNYSNVSINYVKPVGSYSESREDWEAIVPSANNPPLPTMAGIQNGVTPGMQYYQRVLNSIDFPTGQVKFNYSNNRTDINYEAQLDSVQVFSKDKSGQLLATPFKTVVMSYGYFTAAQGGYFNSGSTDNDTKRLKLNQVQEFGYYNGKKEAENPYKFTYCENILGFSMPAKTSLARDHWGYYNGKNANFSLIPSVLTINQNNQITYMLGAEGPERNPDTSFVKAFSLTNIQYPTGGSTEFQYEANDFDDSLSEVNDGYKNRYQPINSLFTQTDTVSYDGFAHTYSSNNTADLRNEAWGYIDPLTSSPIYPLATLSMVFMNRNTNCTQKGLPNTQKIWWDIQDSLGHSVGTVDLGNNTSMCTGSTTQFDCPVCNGGMMYFINKKIQLPPGRYSFVAHSDTSISYMQLIVSWQVLYAVSASGDSTTIPPKFLYAGGLRVKRVIDHDGINSSNDKIKKYVYHYLADKDNNGSPEEYSYGIRMAKPRYTYFTVSWDLFSQFLGGACQSYFFETIHLNRISDSEIPLNGSAAGSVVGYSQVTELFGENGENGKKIYQYTNTPDFVYGYNEGFTGLALPIKPPTGSSIPNAFNGDLLHETDYAKNNNGFVKLKETTNQYYTDPNINVAYGLENRLTPTSNVGEQCQVWISQTCTTNSLITYTALKSQWHYLTTTDEKVYNQGDTTQFVETITNNTYDPLTLLPSTTTVTNSKSQTITTTTKYPLDYNVTTATDAFTNGIKYLQNSNIIAAPVEKYIQKSNSVGGNTGTVGSILTSYNSSSPTPSIIYSAMLASPFSSFAPATVNAGSVVKDASYQSLISFDSYDTYGNILQQHKVNDNSHSYVWDYQNSLPAAEAINAPQSKIACTSFEFDGSGNWTIGSALRDATKGITGIQSYSLANGSISKSTGIVTVDTLIVSYWSTNGQYSVTGSITSLTGKTVTINGTTWTYYEHTVTGVTTVSVSGTGNIDELRLYPRLAQMTSYTFDPLIGMTSQADINNRITYYEYDGLGRLKDVKDQDGNILKTYQYHYQQ